MTWRLGSRVHPDRRILGGRLYLGSTVWAAAHFAVGALLWWLGLYIYRDGVDTRVLLATAAAVSLLVLFRRTAPGAALLAATAVLAVDVWAGPSTAVLLIYGDLLYAACAWGTRRTSLASVATVVAAGAALAAFLVWAAFAGHVAGGPVVVLQLFGLYAAVFGIPLITGWTVREHRERAELLRGQAEQRVRLAELGRATAVAEERGRVARELHDVIANHLSAVAVQSAAALSRRDPDPALTRRVLEVVRDNSVQGLEEMRRMIAVLRADGDQDDPFAPRLSEADLLVRTAREGGLDVRMEIRGTVRTLPAQIDAAAYRVVQESLTNALRYASPRRAAITVDHPRPGAGPETARLVVQIDNPVGAGAPRRDAHGARVGLVGMRERAALLGGDFHAGPAEERGAPIWRVRMELPCVAAEDAAAAPRTEETGNSR